MQCLFLHVPKDVGNYHEILKMPLGLTALASYLNDRRISTKILHLPIEKFLNEHFDLNEYLTKNNVKLLCMDLYWHPQAYSVIENAKKIKHDNPNLKIVLGGFTATLFAEEIISKFPEIDFIIKGDAEEPLFLLADSVINEKTQDSIPNLVWRSGGKVISNAQSYVVSQEILDSLKYSDLKLINNYEIYTRIKDYENALDRVKLEELKRAKSFIYYNVGRGCPVKCSFCGGGCDAQEKINNRRKVIYKSIDSVIYDLEEFKKYGVESIYTSFDPLPDRRYYLDLFLRIKERKLDYNLYFECWLLPTEAFVDAMKDTFGNSSRIIISPDSGSERIRKLNKGYFYGNNDLFAILDYIFKKKLLGDLFFTVGLPFEEKNDIEETIKLIETIKTKYGKYFKIYEMPIELDPGSPMWNDGRKYHVTLDRNNFMDLYEAHSKTPTLGYRTEKLSSEEIINYHKMITEKIRSKE